MSEMDVTLCGRWGHPLSSNDSNIVHFYSKEYGHFDATMDKKLVTCKKCRRSIDRVRKAS